MRRSETRLVDFWFQKSARLTHIVNSQKLASHDDSNRAVGICQLYGMRSSQTRLVDIFCQKSARLINIFKSQTLAPMMSTMSRWNA